MQQGIMNETRKISGPGTVVTCRCGAELTRLSPSEAVVRSGGSPLELACQDCGRTMIVRIVNR